MPEHTSNNQWEKILESFPPRREYLLQAFHKLQESEENRYISEEMIEHIARYFKLTKGEVFGTLSYYTLFSTKPRKSIMVQVCNSPLCHAMDKKKWISQLLQLQDKEVHIEETACLGHCEKGPVIAVNGQIISLQEFTSVQEIIKKIKSTVHGK